MSLSLFFSLSSDQKQAQAQLQLQLNEVTCVVQLYVQAQLQFVCNQFCASQLVQFTVPEIKQLLH